MRIDSPQALLVSSKSVRNRHIADLDRWFRLDRGVAGMTVITVRSVRQAAGLGAMP